MLSAVLPDSLARQQTYPSALLGSLAEELFKSVCELSGLKFMFHRKYEKLCEIQLLLSSEAVLRNS
jgi:hypothetical protein